MLFLKCNRHAIALNWSLPLSYKSLTYAYIINKGKQTRLVNSRSVTRPYWVVLWRVQSNWPRVGGLFRSVDLRAIAPPPHWATHPDLRSGIRFVMSNRSRWLAKSRGHGNHPNCFSGWNNWSSQELDVQSPNVPWCDRLVSNRISIKHASLP